MARRKEPPDWSGNGGEGRKRSGPSESRGRSAVSSEKREASTIMVRGMKDAKERAQTQRFGREESRKKRERRRAKTRKREESRGQK